MQVLSEPHSSRLLQSPKCYFTKRNINQLGEIQRCVQITLAIPQGNLEHMTWDVSDVTCWHVHCDCFYCLTGVSVCIFPLQQAGRHPKDVRQKVFMVQFHQPFVGINVFLGHTMVQPCPLLLCSSQPWGKKNLSLQTQDFCEISKSLPPWVLKQRYREEPWRTQKFFMWPWLSRVNCPTWHSMDIVDPALPWGRGAQAVAVIHGSWCRKKSTASGSNFQEELGLAN